MTFLKCSLFSQVNIEILISEIEKTNLSVTKNMHKYFMKYILINSSADI